MANLTLYIPDELGKKMRRHKEFKWSEIARQAFEERISKLEWMDSVLKDSTLTEEDAIQLGRKVNAGIARRWREESAKRKSA